MKDHDISPLKLDDITFETTGHVEERISRLMSSKDAIRNVYTYFGGVFQARLYIGDRQVTVAHGMPQKCIRMADCALYYFWPYRKKPNREIAETDLHCGIEAAAREINNNVKVRDHLQYIENALIGKQALDPSEKRRARGKVTREELMLAWCSYKSALTAAKLVCVEKNLPAYESAIDSSLTQSSGLISSLDRQLFGA